MAEASKNEHGAPPPDAVKHWRLLRRGANALRSYFAILLRLDEARKPEIYAEVFRSAEFTQLNYWLELFFSIGIATLGLIINSPAVVIGAMLISPLMGPIIASGLAIELGDFYLGLKAVTTVLLSILVSVSLAAALTWMLPFHTPTPEILSRVQPTILDLGVAILSGMAGAVVICRGGSGGGVSALPGVAVAVALMPPLAVVGFGVGIGWDWAIVRGGGLLFLTNLVAIILSSFLVFFSVRMDAPSVRAQINEWAQEQERHERFYELIERTPIRKLLGQVGSLPRRLLVLVIFLAMVSLPLQQALSRLREETRIRRIVLQELHRTIPADATFREDIEFAPDVVRVRVAAVLPQGFPLDERRRLQDILQAQTGRTMQLSILDVATRDELRALSPSTPRQVESLAELRARLLGRLEPAMKAGWPSSAAPLLDYTVSLGPASGGLEVRLAYLSDQEFGKLGEAAILESLRDRTGERELVVRFERVAESWEVEFELHSDKLSARTKGDLDNVARALRSFRNLRCLITTGTTGAANSRLGKALEDRRVAAIRRYLIELGKADDSRVGSEEASDHAATAMVRLVSAEPK